MIKIMTTTTTTNNQLISTRGYSTVSKGYDFDEIKAILDEGLRQVHSLKSKPTYKGTVESIAPNTVQDFTLYEHALAPEGKDFIFKEKFNKYNITTPLLITYTDFRDKCEHFLTLLKTDKTYICHLVALHNNPEIGFRSLMKSFFISSHCDVDKFVGLIYRALNQQLEKYRSEIILNLTFNFKESLLKPVRGPIREIIEVGRDIVKEFDYDWNKVFKDPALFPIQTMIKIESLLRTAFETKSGERLREIHKHLENLLGILRNNFTTSFEVDNYLANIKHMNRDEIEPILKRVVGELKETKEALQLQANNYSKKMEKMAEELKKGNTKLYEQGREMEELKETIKNLTKTIKTFVVPMPKHLQQVTKQFKGQQQPVSKYTPLSGRNIINIWDEINAGVYLLNSSRAYLRDYEILKEHGKTWEFLLKHVNAILEDNVDLNALHKELIKNIIGEYGAFKNYMQTKFGFAVTSSVQHKQQANRLMKKFIGQTAREYSTIRNIPAQWTFDSVNKSASFQWNDKVITYFYERKEWVVFDGSGNVLVSFVDNLEYRTINNQYILYFDSLQIMKTFKVEGKFSMNKVKEEPETSDFAVWDTEEYHTHNPDGTSTMGLLCAAYKLPGRKAKSYYLTDFANAKQLSIKFWLDFIKDADGRVAYAHNAKFDYAYMLEGLIEAVGKDMIEIVRLKSVIKEIRIYRPDEEKGREVALKLHCSLAKTDSSLRNLCKTYKVETPKGYFPYKFPTLELVNYVGPIPGYEWWSGNLNPENDTPYEFYMELYNIYKDGGWSLRETILKHLDLDLNATEQVVKAHARVFWKKFEVNIHKHCTLPSMGKYLICKEGFFNKETAKIIKMSGNAEYEQFIRNSYRGGINDIINTMIQNGISNDCNSMYPNSMLGVMPIGNPVMMIPTIDQLHSDKYVYFVKCTVQVPEMLNPPLLHKNPETGVLHLPVGTFTETFYSPELMNAVKNFGVKILNIKMAVRFLAGKYTFNKYINTIYEIKKEQDALKAAGSPNFSPEIRNATKLILNSSIGGFGMKDGCSVTKIVTLEEAERLSELFPIELYKELSNGLVLLGYKAVPNVEILTNFYDDLTEEERHILEHGIYGRMKVNVAINSAVTALARINLVNVGKSIIDNGGELYKCATDSWYSVGDVKTEYKSNTELGKWKTEHNIKEGIFPSSNIYMLNPGTKKQYVKCGGLRAKYHFELSWAELIEMLKGKPLVRMDNKWTRPIIGDPENAVTIKPTPLNLLPELKKREPIYLDGVLVGGSPIKLENGKRVQYDYIPLFKNSFKKYSNLDLSIKQS